MLKNYLKVAVRYLLRYKTYTAINILGLAVGITCCLLIMLFVRSEFSYDQFHNKVNRIYRVSQHEKYEGQDFVNTVTPLSMASVIQQAYPEVESSCRVFAFNRLVKVGNNSFNEDIRMVDSTFFRVFDFKLLQGDKENPFPNASSVILTNEIAKKYFGNNADVIGKQLLIEVGDEKILFTVSGIAEPNPEESSIRYKLLIPYANAKYMFGPNAFTSWFNVQSETYLVLKEKTNMAALEAKFPAMIKTQLGEDYKEGAFNLRLQPLTAIHLDTSLPAGNEPISNPKYSYILSTIGILLLLVACINFITLSVGRSSSRAMEVGVRKVMGAERRQLIRQFWGEAFLLTLFSVVIGIVLAFVFLKPFNNLTDRNLSIQFDFGLIFFCTGLMATIAIIAGIYPAVILSGFKPIEVLKGKLKMKGNNWLRQSLVVGQFVASIAMIVCTIVISQQMKFLQNKDLGYTKKQVIVVPTNKSRKEGLSLAQLYQTELLKHPEVADVAISLYSFNENAWIEMGITDDKKVYHSFQFNAVMPEFIKTMGIKLKEGRSLDATNQADLTQSALVNEAFVNEFGLKNPVGKKLPGKFDQQIVGVVKDFNYQSLHTKVRPLMMVVMPDSAFRRSENISYDFPPQPRISVRMKTANAVANLAVLEKAWKTVVPNQDFDYKFLDESIAAQYKSEQRTNAIVKIASILSIFIACMGLFGLATLAVVRRTKEIGVRKVLGAGVGSIVGLLSKGFVKMVAMAAIIAFPLAWWFMNDWLKDFAYKVNISWWVFALSGIAALLVALFTVSLQAIKAALTNPVKSLRTE
ncbi:MAG: ABC transporter permease [Sphingobacteriales bacterium]|nr:ABC transporter permease [Sphingobacteriales bacterium]